MNPVPHFSQTYAEARDKFLAAARMRGAKLMQHVHPSARGAAGEKLSMDFALLGSADAPSLLLLISGTHGVEGFCGSGCQVALMSAPTCCRPAARWPRAGCTRAMWSLSDEHRRNFG